MINIKQVIKVANENHASDIHIICGLPIKARIEGALCSMGSNILTDEDCQGISKALLGEEKFNQMENIGEIDLARTVDGIRVRINVFKQQGHFSVAIRILSQKIPVLENLGLPAITSTFPNVQRGIILVTGETGSGKSTTLAAVIDHINHNRTDHIITLEDPIEYVHVPDKCIINQREIGTDTTSFDCGLRAILREDPDVVLIGEMRDHKTIETALTAAETGHFVLATLHTKSAADSIDRIVGAFPADAQPQIRMQLSNCLVAVLSQQLLRCTDGKRTVAAEVMMVTPAIRHLIRDGNTAQIAVSFAQNAAQGSVTMDNCILGLLNNGKISQQVALENAHNPEELKKRILSKTAVPSGGQSTTRRLG